MRNKLQLLYENLYAEWIVIITLSLGLAITLLIMLYMFNLNPRSDFQKQHSRILEMQSLSNYLMENECYHSEKINQSGFTEYYYNNYPKQALMIGYSNHPIDYKCKNNKKFSTTLVIAELSNPNMMDDARDLIVQNYTAQEKPH